MATGSSSVIESDGGGVSADGCGFCDVSHLVGTKIETLGHD